jgi:hypothetical protein
MPHGEGGVELLRDHYLNPYEAVLQRLLPTAAEEAVAGPAPMAGSRGGLLQWVWGYCLAHCEAALQHLLRRTPHSSGRRMSRSRRRKKDEQEGEEQEQEEGKDEQAGEEEDALHHLLGLPPPAAEEAPQQQEAAAAV